MKYAIDLADADDWNEEYRSMSVERKYDSTTVYSARDGGLFTTSLICLRIEHQRLGSSEQTAITC